MSTVSTFPRVHIGEVIRNAVVFNPRNAPVNPDSLIETVDSFFSLLCERQIDYVLVGGVAMLQYVEGRNTEDVDLIMALSSLERVPEIKIETEDANFVRGHFGNLKVDILLANNPLFERVREHYATSQRFVEQEIPCATVEGLILLKLYALPSLYRQGDFARVGLYENDVATLVQAYDPQLETLLRELSAYLSESDFAQVRSIVGELQERITRFDAGNQ
jgi:hypothetical protein